MKKLIKKILMLVLVLCTFAAVGCTEQTADPTEVTIDITASKTTVQKGDTVKFEVVVSGTENKGYSWNDDLIAFLKICVLISNFKACGSVCNEG